jgi:hypothetical protein
MGTVDGRRTATTRRLNEAPLQSMDDAETRRWYGCRFAAQQIEWAMSHAPAPCMIADASPADSDECLRETYLIASRIKELQFQQKSLRCGASFP